MLRSSAKMILTTAAALLAMVAWPVTRAVLATSAHPATAAAAAAPSAGAAPAVTGATFGLETDYTSSYGDTWFNTWGANGDIYAMSDDATGFDGKCNSDLAVNELAGNDPAELTEPYINCMTSFGHSSDSTQDPDGCTWKSTSIISVSGTLYLAVARQSTIGECNDQADGEQPSLNASIVKSTDGGQTWSNGYGTTDDPTGAAPPVDTATGQVDAMFPGQDFSAPFFIQYGQDDNPASTADGGDKYVYAVSNEGYTYDGSDLYLGRVLRSQIGALDAADWQYYDGPPGGDGMSSADWTSSFSDAKPVLTATHQISQPDIEYYPALHEYILTSFNFPFSSIWPNDNTANSSTFDFFEAPHPWGPWTKFLNAPSNSKVCDITCSSAYNTIPLAMYSVAQVPKFASMDGLSDDLFISGDFIDGDRTRYDEPATYALHELPVQLNSPRYRVTDDASAAITYTGNWATSAAIDNGLSSQNDYYDETYHESATTGASASLTFTGTSIQWIGSKGPNYGIASVSVDGGAPVSVDAYAAAANNQQVLFSQNGLKPGKHTITITVSGTANPSSSGTEEAIDAFITSGP